MTHIIRRARAAIALGVVAVALAGCNHNRAQTGLIPDQRTVLKVDNQSFNDMRIYVIQGGQRIRVGTATGKSVASFNLPPSVISGFTTIRVQAVPIGANGSSVSEEMSITPGDELELRISP